VVKELAQPILSSRHGLAGRPTDFAVYFPGGVVIRYRLYHPKLVR